MPSKLNYSRLHKIWADMKCRCSNPKHKRYARYGGRGIKVCKEWQEWTGFENWAYVNGYRELLTLDRIDNDGNYCPQNCKWSTYKEQGNNTSKNHLYEGKTIAQYAEIWGVAKSTARSRILKLEAKQPALN